MIVAFAAILAGFAGLAGAWVYRRLSLEYTGWLRVHAALWPTVVVAAVLLLTVETYFDEHGDWQWVSLSMQGLTAAVALAIAWWHKRRAA